MIIVENIRADKPIINKQTKNLVSSLLNEDLFSKTTTPPAKKNIKMLPGDKTDRKPSEIDANIARKIVLLLKLKSNRGISLNYLKIVAQYLET